MEIRTKAIGFILFFALLLLCGCGQQENYRIAYNVLEDEEAGDYEIYIMDTDGKNQKNISNNKAVDWVYYAYEDKIYFLSDRNECQRCLYLYEMDADGGNVKRITDFKLADSWFSSRKRGTEFIVRPKEAEDASFYIIDLKGNILERIRIELPYVNSPAFSPDGKSIVFRGANKSSALEPGFSDELYVMKLSDNRPRQITFYPEKDSLTAWSGYQAGAPRWRADGKITFASRRNGNYDIYEIDEEGNGMTAVSPTENNQVFHDWLPDGTLIFEASMNNRDGYELFMQQANGTLIQLSRDSIEQYAPVFVKSH
ncbi:hypothetical protein GWK08_12800 [Leptobacterium flavescens]|uniref:DUF5050 domain-containing protein n=1 Tax=Leptobacterium flavescens TaxID=472055 RepID=A0A6P0UM64_9FLAO|nr:PD40 domain-containing protein [Leptobacterium flavescens]NER14324.1 hypothetical protein [Leptobacterium flavescens]